MNRTNNIVAIVQMSVAILLLALFVRTWIVMGLVAPVVVSGSSMAPTLRGDYLTPQCPHCQHSFAVGGEFAAQSEFAACPKCGDKQVSLSSLPWLAGDRLWIDRTVYKRRQPRRGEVVVAVSLHDAEQLCTKRVVALPGERVQLKAGDVMVDGNLIKKSFAEQLKLRQLLHVADGTLPRWQVPTESSWQWRLRHWECRSTDDQLQWLHYQHLHGKIVTDDSSYNAGVTRRLNPVRDLMLTTKLQMEMESSFAVEINDGLQPCRVLIRPGKRLIQAEIAGIVVKTKTLPKKVAESVLNGEAVELACSNFDRQLLLGLDGKVALKIPLPESSAAAPRGVDSPLAVAANGGLVQLEELQLYRDVYYEAFSKEVVQLGDDEYYLLGDNAPISIDSRRWGPVPGRLLIGKPLGVR